MLFFCFVGGILVKLYFYRKGKKEEMRSFGDQFDWVKGILSYKYKNSILNIYIIIIMFNSKKQFS